MTRMKSSANNGVATPIPEMYTSDLGGQQTHVLTIAAVARSVGDPPTNPAHSHLFNGRVSQLVRYRRSRVSQPVFRKRIAERTFTNLQASPFYDAVDFDRCLAMDNKWPNASLTGWFAQLRDSHAYPQT
jgi:hypothetical protein